ncbi:cupin domain-containing protein [Parafrankia sp. FMc2]|uniref:cupin domain-containing protein n=1 Tax=Parafrankia sp. FMc2 TaxID=3233196 RepID=UPI0034D4FC66
MADQPTGKPQEPEDRQADQAQAEQRPRQFFFDIDELPGRTNAEIFGDGEDVQGYLDLLGRDLVTKTIVQTPRLSVFHEKAQPGEQVKPHRHGTHQLNYVLRGELVFGRRRVGPGMGFFTPDLLYAWRAGEEGAEWIEIHAGEPAIFVDQGPTS